MAFPSRLNLTLPRRLRCTPRVELLEQRNLLTFYGGYRTIDELYADTAALTQNYPEITELVDYGDSYAKTVGGVTTPGGEFLAGYDLLAVRVTNRAIKGPKPAFFMLAGIHAREISTPEVGMRWLDYVTQNYGVDADVTWMVDYHEIWVVPITNPDGRWHVELGTQPPYSGNPFLWRKSGHPNDCPIWPPSRNGEAYGVDLNRNFEDHWGGPGSSNDPCGQTYRGTSPASEPETTGVQDLVRTLIPDQRGPSDNDPAPDDTTGIFIDVHTYGGYVLWPWGHTSTPTPNRQGLSDAGRKLATYNGYTAGQSNQTLYATTGTTNGWVYSELGAAAYTIELNSPGFLAPYETLDEYLWPEMLPTFLYAARIARAPYMLARGPDTFYISPYQEGSDLVIFGGHDDSATGGQNIQGAEFYVDVPPWLEGAQPIAMEASDGAYNSPSEETYGYLNTFGLSPGRHTIFVRGQDANGNWGPVTAVFVDIGAGPGPGSGAGLVPALLGGLKFVPVLPEFVIDDPETPAPHLEMVVPSSWTRSEEPVPQARAEPRAVEDLFAIDFAAW